MKDRDQSREVRVRTLVDRRQLLLGIATLAGMALLLAVGLTPRTADAPEALPQAQQAGSDAAALTAEGCQVTQQLTYLPCGHELVRRVALPPDLVGKTRTELEAAYDGWQVTSFSAQQIEMAQSLALYCPEHLVLMPDESGMLCIFENSYGDALAMLRELNLPLSELPEDVQDQLRTGMGFDTQDQLDQWLESMDS